MYPSSGYHAGSISEAGFAQTKSLEAMNSKTLQLRCLRNPEPRDFFLPKSKKLVVVTSINNDQSAALRAVGAIVEVITLFHESRDVITRMLWPAGLRCFLHVLHVGYVTPPI
jgi:hypothetical protein